MYEELLLKNTFISEVRRNDDSSIAWVLVRRKYKNPAKRNSRFPENTCFVKTYIFFKNLSDELKETIDKLSFDDITLRYNITCSTSKHECNENKAYTPDGKIVCTDDLPKSYTLTRLAWLKHISICDSVDES